MITQLVAAYLEQGEFAILQLLIEGHDGLMNMTTDEIAEEWNNWYDGVDCDEEEWDAEAGRYIEALMANQGVDTLSLFYTLKDYQAAVQKAGEDDEEEVEVMVPEGRVVAGPEQRRQIGFEVGSLFEPIERQPAKQAVCPIAREEQP